MDLDAGREKPTVKAGESIQDQPRIQIKDIREHRKCHGFTYPKHMSPRKREQYGTTSQTTQRNMNNVFSAQEQRYLIQ